MESPVALELGSAGMGLCRGLPRASEWVSLVAALTATRHTLCLPPSPQTPRSTQNVWFCRVQRTP